MTNAELLAKIKAEIERRWKDYRNSVTPDQPKYRTHYFVGKGEVCEELLSFLSTLESEKPMELEGLEEDLTNEADKMFFSLGFYEGDHHQPMLDEISLEQFRGIARHFAQWGAEHFRDITKMISGSSEIPNDLEKAAEEYAEKHGFRVPYDGSDNFYDDVDVKASKEGFITGAKWDREQIMKEAVECELVCLKDQLLAVLPIKEFQWTVGDKVRIIIVKEDEK